MWNLSIPYALKYYIDCIVQPGYSFRYDEAGHVVPLVLGKKMVVASSRGSDYSAGGPMHAFDFQEPYLRAIFGFIGITDVEFVSAQPMDASPALRDAALAVAAEQARVLALRDDWELLTSERLAARALPPSASRPGVGPASPCAGGQRVMYQRIEVVRPVRLLDAAEVGLVHRAADVDGDAAARRELAGERRVAHDRDGRARCRYGIDVIATRLPTKLLSCITIRSVVSPTKPVPVPMQS